MTRVGLGADQIIKAGSCRLVTRRSCGLGFGVEDSLSPLTNLVTGLQGPVLAFNSTDATEAPTAVLHDRH